MARETGNGVTIGSSVNNNYLYIDWSTVDEPSNNRTLVYWAAGFHYTSSDAQLDDCDISINGLRYDNPGRVKNYAGTFTTRDHGIVAWNTPGYSAFYIDHNSAGEASITISGSIGGSLSARSTISSRSYPLTNYNRSANTPYYNNITRNSATNIYVTYARTGSVNGPTTYVLERATNAAMTENYTTFGEGNQTVNANTAYYYRMYAYGDEGGNKYSGVYGPYWGQPVPPTNVTATRSDSVAGRINIYWTKPSNTQGGIDYYHVYRDGVSGVGTYIGQHNGETAPTSLSPFQDNSLPRGTDHTYYVYAHNTSGFWSDVSAVSNTVKAPGVPGKPSTVNTPTRVGRNVTVTAPKDANGYGNTVTSYRIQYATSDDNYATWYGWNGTSGVLNDYNVMDTSGSEASFYYEMLTAAKTYKFRVYAVNSIGVGDQTTDSAVLATGWFLPASGKKWDGTSWNPTAIAKRWNPITSTWTDISIAKRYSSITGNWEELT